MSIKLKFFIALVAVIIISLLAFNPEGGAALATYVRIVVLVIIGIIVAIALSK